MEISFDNILNHVDFSLAGMYNEMTDCTKLYAHVQMMYKKSRHPYKNMSKFKDYMYIFFWYMYNVMYN